MALITVFYGEMGAGKSHRAREHASRWGVPFYEGDDAVTPEMQRYVLNRPIPKRVLDDFLYGHLVPAVLKRAETTSHLVTCQALYRREHRRRVRELLEAAGHQVTFVLVSVPARRNLRQLWGRRLGLFWVLYHWAFEP